ncbi:MAG: phage GP46 family protein [Patescibacteria group bacterium]|nr:phage GP46 family protein [Patescibacteria group bacterium]
MSDITSLWNAQTQRCDYAIAGGAFQVGADVETAVLISLFTDRLANIDDVLPNARPGYPGDRKGWWGDDPRNLMGSRLWLLNRAKGPMNVAAQAEDYAAEALQWMINDGVVARFDIQAQWVSPNQLNLRVVAYRSNGTAISNQSLSLW